MNIEVPSAVQYILDQFFLKGYEAFIVGGCVRDSLLSKTPKDWDITTNAAPDITLQLFDHTIPTGLPHGTVTVLVSGECYEVTTYRIDGQYVDNRKPSSVQFTKNIEEDLSRRDFTVNAMAYHPNIGIIDPFGGQKDLNDKLIRCVGNPTLRFQEDALRIMRAIRFSCQLGFSIDPKTKQAISSERDRLRNISQERIRDEWNKSLLSPYLEFLSIYYELGVISLFLPSLFPLKKEVNLSSLFNTMKNLNLDLSLRWAFLWCQLNHSEENKVDEILKQLRYDSKTIQKVKLLVLYCNTQWITSKYEIKKYLYKIGPVNYRDLLHLQYAVQSLHTSDIGLLKEKYNQLISLLEEITVQNECYSLSQLALTGKELIQAGFSPGPSLGKLLEELLYFVMEEPTRNQKNILLSHILNNHNSLH